MLKINSFIEIGVVLKLSNSCINQLLSIVHEIYISFNEDLMLETPSLISQRRLVKWGMMYQFQTNSKWHNGKFSKLSAWLFKWKNGTSSS